MMRGFKRTSFLALTVFFLLTCGVAQSSQEGAPPASTAAVTDIQLSFKRDPRVVDPYRGIGPWVSGPNYAGATAQDTVETVARAVDAKGQPLNATLEWTPSDPEMVTVSPSQGAHVRVTVHKVGQSQLKIRAQGFSKDLVVKATSAGKFLVFEITQPATKPGGAAKEISPALKTKEEQLSYAVGMRLAKTLQKQSLRVDADLVKQGIQDALSGGQTLMSEEQAHVMLVGVQTELSITEASFEKKVLADKNKKDGEQFLTQNGKRDGVVTLPSGLQYKVIKAGDGKKPTAADVAVCSYRATLLDGTEFDNSSKHRGGGPVTFPLKGVIKGWQEALQLMPAGSKWQLFVPPDLAYGERGVPRVNVGPNATLIFEVELLSVKELVNKAPPMSTSTQATPTTEQTEAVKKALQGAGQKEAETEPEKNQ
jgi:FKBP-type peptidyl-prolyl cis-trans isomerase FklB